MRNTIIVLYELEGVEELINNKGPGHSDEYSDEESKKRGPPLRSG